MGSVFNKFRILWIATRGYSTPISFMSWLVPAIFAYFNGGNLLYGFIALPAIVNLHMATNLFDDAIDLSKEKIDLKKGLKKDFNLQKGKCACIINGQISHKQAYIISFVMFFLSLLVGLFFIYIWGSKLLYIIIPSIIICLLYPILGNLGLGEVLVSTIFSPLIYSGVYFIMCGNFSKDILILSISTGLLTVAVLHNHMLLDYKYDTSNRKITLCRICGSEKNAYSLLSIIVFGAYINLIIWVCLGKLELLYLLPFVTLPKAIELLKVMKTHVEQKQTSSEQDFLFKFILVEKVLTSFTIMLCSAIVICHYIINN